VQPSHSDKKDTAVLIFDVGTERPNITFADLDRLYPQTPHTKAIRGLKFTGIDADVVMFGDVGAMVTTKGIRWVKAA